jgi:predicted tellurium resistance membrane protein TerC
MDWLTDPQTWIAFITLFALEVVLGVDNVVFVSILAGKLPADRRPRARTVPCSPLSKTSLKWMLLCRQRRL